jgi:hypothetical protein
LFCSCFYIYQGLILAGLGFLLNLTHLRLSYNEFTGNKTHFVSLQHLKLIHLQGNRLCGTIPELNLVFQDTPLEKKFVSYAFILDCGNPSDFKKSLTCEECTMSCQQCFALIFMYHLLICINSLTSHLACLVSKNIMKHNACRVIISFQGLILKQCHSWFFKSLPAFLLHAVSWPWPLLHVRSTKVKNPRAL